MTTSYVITVDADTLLHPEALRRLVSRLETAPDDTVAVAGSVLVRNSRQNFLTRMQEWDYFLGIAAVKRVQGLYQSTLVAQGAFSLYRTEHVRAIGGWPDAIGEDIVVTWRLMAGGQRVYFEPTAVAFTDVPTRCTTSSPAARWALVIFRGPLPPPPPPFPLSPPPPPPPPSSSPSPPPPPPFLPPPPSSSLPSALPLPCSSPFSPPLLLPFSFRSPAPPQKNFSALSARGAGTLRLPRVPPALPGAVLRGVDRGLRAGDRGHPPAVEVGEPGVQSEPGRR